MSDLTTRNNSCNFMRQRNKTNILLVDDSAIMRKIVARSLREAELPVGEIYEAANGVEGLDVLKTGKEIHLILSDVNMPVMDGIEFVKAAKSAGYKTPIVMVTTENEDVLNQAFDNGALTSIKKPFTSDHLRERLTNFF